MNERYDRCVKTSDDNTIWMVRERTKSRVPFENWEDYVEAGEPDYAIITEEELEEYDEVSYFRG